MWRKITNKKKKNTQTNKNEKSEKPKENQNKKMEKEETNEIEPKKSSAIIIDHGSGMLKVGYSGDSAPIAVFPSIVQKPKHMGVMVGMGQKDCYVGKEPRSKRGLYNLKRTLVNGMVSDWGDMERIWGYTFKEELGVDAEEHEIFLTLKYDSTQKSYPEKMTEIMFEKFNIPAFHFSLPEPLSLHTYGRTTGVVLDIGHSFTTIDAFMEGNKIQEVRAQQDLAGNDLTDYLLKILAERGYSFTTTAEREIVRDVKEKLCYVALDFDQEMILASQSSSEVDMSYELPDGQVITIGDERFRCPEVLFQPSPLDSKMDGIHEIVYNTINESHVDFQETLYHNIILSGGSTLFDGMKERLQQEIQKLAPKTVSVKVASSEERKYAAWIGASILTSLSTFEDRWILKKEYNESGAAIVHKKC
ncbi:actin-7-related [Anaeramoeba flamelloides]|uniref:Actin-7-related n=1 Tax=Anaeramoeba flamelloides TaxID=1746091 RepID=A0ABQ8XJK6_9EUKA|nr:actin-7-related [Anaeramoeba flamelloides]